jgi:hypothetical protein
MRRRPLSTAAFLFVVAAHLTVALAGERIEPGKPWKATGTVTVETREFTLFGDKPIVGRAYFLTTSADVRISLLPDSKHTRVLDRLADTLGTARVEGICHEVNRRPFLLVETIEELTP